MWFGSKLKLGRDVLLIGDRDKLRVFRRSGDNWAYEVDLPSAPVGVVPLGDVAIYKNVIVVGAVSDGAAYVYRFTDGTWNLDPEPKLTVNDPDVSCSLDIVSVAVGQDIVVVGAPGIDIDPLTEVGVVYIFTRSGSSWIQTDKIGIRGQVF